MSRIDATFAALRARGEKALLPYLSVGFPEPGETAALALALLRAGAGGADTCHPPSVLPSNSSCQPCARSSRLSVFIV